MQQARKGKSSLTSSYCIILTTTGELAEADKIAELLVERHLAASVQINPVRSIYTWEGKVNRETEFVLSIKTRPDLYPRVETAILENHTYQVPEIIQIPIESGYSRYLDWIDQNTL